jgi:hypothetical protein
MPPAVIAGGVAAAGAIGGALIGSKSQSHANAQAAQTQDNATAAQLQLGQQSLAMGQNIYNSNYDVLSPYASRGNVAGNALNALLGLPAAPAMHSPLAQSVSTAPMPATGSSVPQTPAAATPSSPAQFINAQLAAKLNALNPDGPVQGAPVGAPHAPPVAAPHTPPIAAPRPAAGAPAGQTSPLNAMTNFANSAGMKFALQSGADQINNGAAANGWLQSGAALKALQQNGQNIALQQYFPMYTGLLGQQQAVGAGAASSIAGVGQNFANSAANINNGMGNAINSGAQNIGNIQLANGQNQANMWGTIGGALGGFASSFPINRTGHVSGSGGF